jgi:hypothetical protein
MICMTCVNMLILSGPLKPNTHFIFLECESNITCIFKYSKETKFVIPQDTEIHSGCVDTIHIVRNCAKVYPMQAYNAIHAPCFVVTLYLVSIMSFYIIIKEILKDPNQFENGSSPNMIFTSLCLMAL